MSLDLYQTEASDALSNLRPVDRPDPSAFDGFVRGTGLATMRGFARAASGIDLAGGAIAKTQDAILGTGTEAQDRYFKEHDDVFGSAVKYWTPEPNEVGMAGEVVGGLLSTLPLVILSPHLAVSATQLSAAEELVQKGVGAGKAQAVGAVQGAGLGLGIWMPILGQNLWQRVFIGGAGFNVAQGVAMRGASGMILEGTPAAEEFKAFDGKALTLDVLMGMAFGSLVHLSPAQREAGKQYWTRLMNWAGELDPSQVDAVAALRQSQHLNVDSAPGKLAEAKDVEAHVQRMRSAIDQIAKGDPVAVDDLPRPQFEPDPARTKDALKRFSDMSKVAEKVRQEEGIAPIADAYPVSPHLKPEDQAIERKAYENLADFDKARKAYEKLPESDDGKILNTDIARELSPDYSASKESRSRLAPAVHEPSSDLIKRLYVEKLKEPSKSGLNMVTFTAGGAGAGKTTAISGVPIASKIAEVSDFIYDTNMNNFASAKAKVDMALEAGKQVNILYVGRDPVDALVNGAIPRAERMGRTVVLTEHAKTHIGVADVIGRLEEAYAGNDKVQIIHIDNTRGKGGASIGNSELPRSFNLDNLEVRLKEALDAEHEAGRVSDHVYSGIAGHEPGAAPQALAQGARGVRGGAGGEGAKRELGQGTGSAAREELGPAQPPAPGEPFLVYRLGESGELKNRNAGNADAVARYIMGTEDAMGPISSKAGKVFAYEVTVDQPFGNYEGTTGGRALQDGAVGRITRKNEVAYSFPETGYKAKVVGEMSLADLRAELQKSGFASFDDAGTDKGALAIREAFKRAGAPAAIRGGAEPPPPRGAAAGEAAGAEVHPALAEAERLAQEYPDVQLRVGSDASGEPIVRTVADYLADAKAGAAKLREQAKLLAVASECLLGVL